MNRLEDLGPKGSRVGLVTGVSRCEPEPQSVLLASVSELGRSKDPVRRLKEYDCN